jgi:RNA polymerase sigma factor (sigma-70 family)
MNLMQSLPAKEKTIAELSGEDERILVEQILLGQNTLAANFLKQKCIKSFEYILHTRLRGLNLDVDDLVNDFYIFLQENNWEKLRKFRFESRLHTWLNLLASRYLLKKYARELKECSGNCTPIDDIKILVNEDAENKLVRSDILEAISFLNNKRYQQVLLMGLQGFDADEIADQLGINANNVYGLRSKAIKKLKNLLNG